VRAYVDSWSPSALFASSEVGVWYDPSDFDTMWKDTAGTTPVTAVDDLVARIDDKSGNGFHATQETEANRPVLKQDSNGNYYLQFDGTDDTMFSDASLTVTPDWTQIVGVDFSGSGSSTTYLGYFSVINGTTNYAQLTRRPSISSGGFATRGASATPTAQGLVLTAAATNSLPDNTPKIVSGFFTDGATALQINDATLISTSNSWSESDSVGSAIVYLMSISNSGETTKFYNMLAVNRELTTQELSDAKDYLAEKAGVTL